MLQTTVGSHLWSPTWWQVVLDPKVRLRRLHSANTLPINANFQVSGEFLSGPPAYGGLVIFEDDVKRPFRRMRRQRHSLSILFFAGDAPGAVFRQRGADLSFETSSTSRKTANKFPSFLFSPGKCGKRQRFLTRRRCGENPGRKPGELSKTGIFGHGF